ncbi:MAG: UDP-N-acetylmuramate dehydrogenase [Oscillospiraceae bacterium]
MPWYETFDRRAAEELPALEYVKEEPMSRHTSFRIGGPARRMTFPKTGEELAAALRLAADCGGRSFLLGNGTNLLAADEGVDALVADTTRYLTHVELLSDGVTLRAEAGTSLAALAVFAAKHSLTGLEFAHGIPGSLGGAVVMNAGAYGGEMAQVVTKAAALGEDGAVRVLTGEELAFGYRRSVFSDSGAAVLWAELRLAKGEESAIRARMEELMQRRRASQPLELPSAGSTFKRPAGYFAGPLIEKNGFKGVRAGGAQVSEKHAGFIVNTGGATCADVLALIAEIQQTVLERDGVALEPEVKLIR